MIRHQRCRSWGTLLDTDSGEQERPPETEAEYVRYLQMKIAAAQQRHLLPLKEDVTDWLNATLGTSHITVDNYMAQLDSGILLCQLARTIAQRAALSRLQPQETVPTFKFKCWDRARSRSFFARDNVYNFLQFCRQMGCQENFLFETDGLVMHTQPRGVLLCLLELGRRSSRYVEPPVLVQLEQEIEEQERLAAARDGSDSGYSDTAQERERSAERDLPDHPATSPRPTSLIPVRRKRTGGRRNGTLSMPGSALTSPTHHRSTPRLSVPAANQSAASTPSRIPRPQHGSRAQLVRMKMALQSSTKNNSTQTLEERTQQLRERLHQLELSPQQLRGHPPAAATSSSSATSSPTCRTPTRTPSIERSILDKKVQQMVEETAASCKCRNNCISEVQLRRVAEGQYCVAGRTVFIRLLKGRHVMVRVGGGWDTLEHFLTRHDPCQSATLPETLASSSEAGTTEMFLRLPATPRQRTRHQIKSNG